MAFEPVQQDTEEMQRGRELRKEQDTEVQQVLEPQSLARDRDVTAKEIVFNIGEWVHKTNVLDYRGGDVKRVPTEKKKRRSYEDLVDNPYEAKRVLKYVLEGKAEGQHKIKDFDSFKEAFRQEFQVGGKNGVRLWDYINGQDDLLLKLYANSDVQDKVTTDSRSDRIPQLMKKYNITKDRANAFFEQVRIHEIQLIQEGMLPVPEREEFKIPTALAPTRPMRRVIDQHRGATLYRRTLPVRFTQPQQRFLRNNPNVPSRKVTAMFNSLFGSQRTISSVYNQRYRLLKRGE